MRRANRIDLSRPALRAAKRQSGFTLVEVLVSALLLSIGLVGLAGLQAAALSNNQSSFMRSQVTALAYDLADRMRANVAGANANAYDPVSMAITEGCSTTTGCSSQQMAQNDIAEWNTAIATYLPMGQGWVCIDSTPNDGSSAATPQCDGVGTQFAVKIWWDDNRNGVIDHDIANQTVMNMERLTISYQL